MKYNNFMPKGIKGFQKGHPVPKNIREILRQVNIGKEHSEKTKEKMRLAHVGKKYKPMSKKGRENLSVAHKGKKFSKKTRKKMSDRKIGRKHSEETKIRMKETQRKRFLNHIYKTDESKILRNRIEYHSWRESVFARDNWTCQKYGTKGGELHPHHIKNFAAYPKLRLEIDNGITLSEKAHKEFHKKYGSRNNNKKQLKEFLT